MNMLTDDSAADDSSDSKSAMRVHDSPFLASKVPSNHNTNGGNSTFATICIGAVAGSAAFSICAVCFHKYIFTIQLFVLGAENQYEVDLHPGKVPLTLFIWLLFTATAMIPTHVIIQSFGPFTTASSRSPESISNQTTVDVETDTQDKEL